LAGLEQLAGPDAQGNRSAWEEWLQELKVWRTQVHEAMSYSDERYAHRPWTQRNFVSPQMHPFDLAFYTKGKGYTVDEWLDGLLQRYGGIDSLLLWVTYAIPPPPSPCAVRQANGEEQIPQHWHRQPQPIRLAQERSWGTACAA